MINAIALVSGPDDWTNDKKIAAPASRTVVRDAFAGYP